MKKTILVLVLAMAVASVVFTSCASSRGGCKMSQGFSGYGGVTGR
ncbi:MAG TPA: hypothetical protein VNS58_07020 [Puia sp.]|nr:hypothetical protein [Puia sp.]